MRFGGLADILQAQMMDLMASLDYVQAYIDDLLIITRGTIDNRGSHLKNRDSAHIGCAMPESKSMQLSHSSVPMK